MRLGITSVSMLSSIFFLLVLTVTLFIGSDVGAASGVSDRILSFGIPGGSEPANALVPGSISLRSLQEDRIRVASTGPRQNSIGWESTSLMDSIDRLEEVGKRVGDPVGLYSSFLIEVERAKYSVNLYGYNDDGEKTVLFSCKAGLGSSEYPTPRGSFYITRIFDNKPLWIPPQDKDWAYGQSPSRSVYGGHMMPFLSKVQAAPPPKSDDLNSELDVVAPPMKMVDSGAYRIHGTDSPWSVGSAQSHGCVRLLNSSVAQLADTLKMYVGTTTRGQSPNGVFINLARPVKLVLY
ncbi:MAG: L,D-transpeptidase [Deltaproteobacteria bacterium]|nr:L,D-transpeptidase [Deltaproteobacteria bacterium]